MKTITPLTTMADAAMVLSAERAVICKHSTRCPISGGALHAFREVAGSWEGEDRFYIVDVIGDRDVSNAVASISGISHESPQVMVIRDGAVTWHASHFGITADSIRRALA